MGSRGIYLCEYEIKVSTEKDGVRFLESSRREKGNRTFYIVVGIIILVLLSLYTLFMMWVGGGYLEEGMAGRADFDMHLFALGGKDLLAVAAGTSDCGLVDFGLDIFFHHNLYKCYLKCRTYRHLELSAHTHGLAAASVLVQSSKAAYCALGSTADMRQGAVKESSNRSKQQKWQALEKPLFRHNCAFHTLEAHNFPLL